MDGYPLLKELNEQQQQAVSAPLQHMLVLAGAGSGKTRVLVHRIAWLIEQETASPFGIFAVTFTNKAAAEMRQRIEALLNMPLRGMWVGTFHSLAHRLLRTHWEAAGLAEHFQILDSDDQYRLIRRVIKTLELDEEEWPPKQVQWYINHQKDQGLRPRHIDHHGHRHEKGMLRIYEAYEDVCNRSSLVDFTELLLRVHELLRDNEDILKLYQQRFQHILIDEFQDTNTIQYAWIKLLAGDSAYVMMVGDDDQSIYGWRGARIENIQRCHQDFPNLRTICLEQNYRSTGVILEAANALISNNDTRLGKNLWTDGNRGEPIFVYSALNEQDESRFVIERIQSLLEGGYARSDIAILYRSNAQSRVLEEGFLQAGLPYRVYGGLRFFDRAEIKDALAYLRLIMNRHDDAAFERVVNFPTRGIGDKTLETVRSHARANNASLWHASKSVISTETLPARAAGALGKFLELIDSLDLKDVELNELAEHVLQYSGLMQHFKTSKNEKARARVENLEELIAAMRQFEMDEEETLTPLAAFLSHAALEAGVGQADEFEESIQLMTLHSAKGLEFPIVFITGVEEGLFPHKMSLEEEGRLEEERRLCYVGMTRAKEQLYLSYAEIRRMYWADEYHRPSRFLSELPSDCLQEIRYKRPSTSRGGASGYNRPSRPISSPPKCTEAGDTGFKLGQAVRHAHFGEGTVINYEGRGSSARLQVQFTQHGAKWLVLSHANLEVV